MQREDYDFENNCNIYDGADTYVHQIRGEDDCDKNNKNND